MRITLVTMPGDGHDTLLTWAVLCIIYRFRASTQPITTVESKPCLSWQSSSNRVRIAHESSATTTSTPIDTCYVNHRLHFWISCRCLLRSQPFAEEASYILETLQQEGRRHADILLASKLTGASGCPVSCLLGLQFVPKDAYSEPCARVVPVSAVHCISFRALEPFHVRWISNVARKRASTLSQRCDHLTERKIRRHIQTVTW